MGNIQVDIFIFWLENGSMCFIFQPSSMEVKKRWAKEITNLLQSQFNQVKGL